MPTDAQEIFQEETATATNIGARQVKVDLRFIKGIEATTVAIVSPEIEVLDVGIENQNLLLELDDIEGERTTEVLLFLKVTKQTGGKKRFAVCKAQGTVPIIGSVSTEQQIFIDFADIPPGHKSGGNDSVLQTVQSFLAWKAFKEAEIEFRLNGKLKKQIPERYILMLESEMQTVARKMNSSLPISIDALLQLGQKTRKLTSRLD